MRKNTVLKDTEYVEESRKTFQFQLENQLYEFKAILRNDLTLYRVPIECVPTDIPLPCPIYVKINDNFVLFRLHQDEISKKRLQELITKGLSSIYIPKVLWEHFIKYQETFNISKEIVSKESLRYVRALLMGRIGKNAISGSLPTKEYFEKIKLITDWIAIQINHEPSVALTLLYRNPDPQAYFENHAANSSIYCALLGHSLNYPLNDLKILAFGGSVHDIGNVFIPKEILYKEGKLSPFEIALVRTHCEKGAELLKSINAEPLVVLMAMQHHERVDKKGYPLGISGKDIHPFSKIAAISDVFDAMTCNRPHKSGLSTRDALRKMRAEEGLLDVDFLGKLSFGMEKT